jgi:low affinity Fe/Cu permease
VALLTAVRLLTAVMLFPSLTNREGPALAFRLDEEVEKLEVTPSIR